MSDARRFWTGARSPAPRRAITPPPVTAALPLMLGRFPAWRGSVPLLGFLEPIYAAASELALGHLVGGEAPAASAPTNPLCERLGIAVPHVEDVKGRRGVKLFHLLVVALLERGEPMTLDEAVARLRAAGVEAPGGDLTGAVQKSWHGSPPVYRDVAGRLGVDPLSDALLLILFKLDLGGGAHQHALGAPPAPEYREPGDDEPLSFAEVSAALGGPRRFDGVSPRRLVAGVLDAAGGGPLTLAQVARRLGRLSRGAVALDPAIKASRLAPLIATTSDGLRLVRGAADLRAVRRQFRAWARSDMRRAHERAHAGVRAVARPEEAPPALARRAILHVLPAATAPRAAAVLDLERRQLQTFVGDALQDVGAALEGFDLVAGPHVRDALGALSIRLVDRVHLVDLKPPQRQVALDADEGGGRLPVTLHLVARGTVGSFLSSEEDVAHCLAAGGRSLLRLLGRDAAVWAQVYRFGALHGHVYVNGPEHAHSLRVDWTVPGEPTLHELLLEAKRRSAPIDLVIERVDPVAETDPFATARRFEVVGMDMDELTLREGRRTRRVARNDVLAARLAPADVPAPARPGRTAPALPAPWIAWTDADARWWRERRGEAFVLRPVDDDELPALRDAWSADAPVLARLLHEGGGRVVLLLVAVGGDEGVRIPLAPRGERFLAHRPWLDPGATGAQWEELLARELRGVAQRVARLVTASEPAVSASGPAAKVTTCASCAARFVTGDVQTVSSEGPLAGVPLHFLCAISSGALQGRGPARVVDDTEDGLPPAERAQRLREGEVARREVLAIGEVRDSARRSKLLRQLLERQVGRLREREG